MTDRIGQWQRRALLTGIAFSLISIVGLVLDREMFLRSYLFAFLYWGGLAFGGLTILFINHTVGGKWGIVIRRMCEAGSRTLWVTFLMVIPVLISIPALYIWARPEALHDENIQKKTAWLNQPGFIVRTLIYFAIVAVFVWFINKMSQEQDRTHDETLIKRMRALAAPGLVVIVFTVTFCFIDWVMSLEPQWFSTVYGALFLVGLVLDFFAISIIVLAALSDSDPFRRIVTPQHFHDLGNMLFTFMILWAYLSFSQFLIMWAGNLPEEISWYLRRTRGGWGLVGWSLIVFHFCAPFAILLQRGVKRRKDRLVKMCFWLLAIHAVDVFWVVEPAFYGGKFTVHWTDFATFLALGGLWLAAFFWHFKSRPLLPEGDSRLIGPPRETVAF